MNVLVDTNVLLRLSDTGGDEHGLCNEVVQRLLQRGDIAARWRRIVNQHGVCGKPAHDARLVAVMESHGLTHLLTLNTADFARYSAITPLHPRDVK